MSIPDFQTLMRPLLLAHADGKEHLNRDLVSNLAEQFNLSDDERREMLPSGRARVFDNRIGWAKSHISQAGLLDSPRRAISIITDRGRKALKSYPERIDLRTLNEFEEYREFRNRRKDIDGCDTTDMPKTEEQEQETPEELLENAYLRVRRQVETELLALVKSSPPDFLEPLLWIWSCAWDTGEAGRTLAKHLDGPGMKGLTVSSKKTLWDWTLSIYRPRDGTAL